TAFSTAAASIALPFIPVFDTYHPFIKGIVIGLIPVVAFTSIARGYFMGVQKMGKIAIANVLKKIIQLLCLFLFFQWYSFELDMAVLISLF
ncbi:multidrug transporter MatE, partial [Xanthomonas citri pv. citri]|nr:multidrug transporter MatE [Xanthomonas citri pv. citri]